MGTGKEGGREGKGRDGGEGRFRGAEEGVETVETGKLAASCRPQGGI